MSVAKPSSLTAPEVRCLLSYDPHTGAMHWRKRVNSKVPAGARAGRVNEAGYRIIAIQRRYYRSSRLIWLMVTGAWPAHYIDHINRIRDDDRWANLREATPQENQRNRPKALRATSKTTFKGVHPCGGSGWCAHIHDGKRKHWIGVFSSAEDAARAYDATAIKLFGEFAFLNFSAEAQS